MLGVLVVKKIENVCFEVPSGTFLAQKSDFIGGHCTPYCNENLIKPPSLHISPSLHIILTLIMSNKF